MDTKDNGGDSTTNTLDVVPSGISVDALAGAATERAVSAPSFARGAFFGGIGGLYEPLDSIVFADVSAEHGGEKPVVSMAAN